MTMANPRKITSPAEFIQELEKQASITKKNLTVVTPASVEPTLALLSQAAYAAKRVKFIYIAHFDLKIFGQIIPKVKTLGNLQLRQLEGPGTFWGCNRDDVEVVYGSGVGNALELIVSQDHADVERIKVKFSAEILPGSKIL